MLTSSQYANLLLKKLQICFSCSDTGYRAYLYNFYGEMFTDPSVILTEDSYRMFVNLMDEEMDYAAKNNLYNLEDVYYSPRFNDGFVILQNSFQAIGIQLVLTKDNFLGLPNEMIFTLPSGKVMTWTCSNYNGVVRVRTQLRATDDYLRRMRAYYLLSSEEGELLTDNINVAGLGTQWEFDQENGTVTVLGQGTLASFRLWQELGIYDDISTVIVGSGVNYLTKSSMQMKTGTSFVFLQSENAPVRIADILYSSADSSSSPKYTYNIYTDNLAIRNHVYQTNPNVTLVFHPLSDYDMGQNYVAEQEGNTLIIENANAEKNGNNLTIT